MTNSMTLKFQLSVCHCETKVKVHKLFCFYLLLNFNTTYCLPESLKSWIYIYSASNNLIYKRLYVSCWNTFSADRAFRNRTTYTRNGICFRLPNDYVSISIIEYPSDNTFCAAPPSLVKLNNKNNPIILYYPMNLSLIYKILLHISKNSFRL